jgi:hypothetical protein
VRLWSKRRTSFRPLPLDIVRPKMYLKRDTSVKNEANAEQFNFEFLQHIDNLVREKVQNALFVPSMRSISADKVERLFNEQREYKRELEEYLQKLPDGLCLDPNKDKPHDLISFDFAQIKGYAEALEAIGRHLDVCEAEARHLLWSLVFRKKSFKLDDEYVEQMMLEMNDKLQLLLQHFSKSEVEYHFQFVWYRLAVLNTRIIILQNLGVQQMRTEYLLHFKTLMSITPIQLKQLNIIRSDVCVFANLLSVLDDLPPSKRDEIRNTYLSDVDSMSIARIKENIIKEYLNYRIDCKTKIMKNFAAFFNLTIQNVKQVLDFIEKGRNGIPLNVVKNTKFRNTRDWSYIILLNAELLHQFEREFNGQFLGKNIRYIVMQSPTIFSSIENIKRKMHLLKHYYSVPDKNVLTHMQVFTLHYNTILCRTQYWIGVLGRRATQHKHFLLLLRNHSKCIELRRALAGVDLQKMPLDLFFFHFHHMRKNLHFYSRSFTGSKREVLQRFANHLDVDVYRLSRTLKQHKYWKEMDTANATRVFQLLFTQLTLSAEQLRRSIYVILYDHKQVQEVIDQLQHQFTAQQYEEWRQHPLFVELIIYHLEKEHNFDSSVVLRRNFPKNGSQTDRVSQALTEFDNHAIDLSDSQSNGDSFDLASLNSDSESDSKLFDAIDCDHLEQNDKFDAFEQSLDSMNDYEDVHF